jgi:hypothetical protein
LQPLHRSTIASVPLVLHATNVKDWCLQMRIGTTRDNPELRMPVAPTSSQAAAWIGNSASRALAAGMAAIAALHIALFGFYLVRTAITSPISDMFAYLASYLRFRAGEIGLFDYLWQAHGEHRLLWIRLLTWADVELFHTRGIPFIAAATTAISATAVLVWHQLCRAEPKLGRAVPLALLAVMLILSTANVVDCSVPINTTYPITVFFVVLALVLFAGAAKHDRYLQHRRAAAMLAAVGAGLATAAGLLVWPILLWAAWRGGAGRRWMTIIIAFSAVYGVLYVRNLPVHGLAPALGMDLATWLGASHIWKMTDYFFAFLGLPFTREPALGALGRIAGAALFLVGSAAFVVATLSKRLDAPLDRIVIGMILLALGAAALASVGRGDLVDEVKVPVRYTMFVTSLHVGLLCLLLPRFVRQIGWASVPALPNALGFGIAAMLLIQQVAIGQLAAAIADDISRQADCFAEGIHTGQLSQAVTKEPQAAERVLTVLPQLSLLSEKDE